MLEKRRAKGLGLEPIPSIARYVMFSSLLLLVARFLLALLFSMTTFQIQNA